MDFEKALSELKCLFTEYFGPIKQIEKLPGAGSDRIYWRFVSEEGRSVIGTWGKDIKENFSFLKLTEIFKKENLNVPEIYAVNPSGEVYLQEDLGRTDLLSLLQGKEKEDKRFVCDALDSLLKFQSVDPEKWEMAVFNKPFSIQNIKWDLDYFKYDFLKPAGFFFDEYLLQEDFDRLAYKLDSYGELCSGFMYRDFQSRNILVNNDKLKFIDYQGGRKGPAIYDAVSFLWQVKARFSDKEKDYYLSYYLKKLSTIRKVSIETLEESTPYFILLRLLQVLGAYGFRGLIEKKSHFIESLPGALKSVNKLIEKGNIDEFPELKKVLKESVKSRFNILDKEEGLTIKVFSFSYKKGYPEDLSGNGGGFMFDCRGMYNPGRIPHFKTLTGKDEEIVSFLEGKGEVQVFLKNTFNIVSPTIKNYLERNFNSLQIGFGCTGGQHRSVYCAENLAKLIKTEFPAVKIKLIHRELGENIVL